MSNAPKKRPARTVRAPEAPALAVEREMIVPGAGVARRPLYSAPVTRQGWQSEMLQAVAVAKALGVTRFEIDVEGDVFQRRKESRDEEYVMLPSLSFMFRAAEVEMDDEWKAAKPDATQTKRRPAAIVTVYAVVVE